MPSSQLLFLDREAVEKNLPLDKLIDEVEKCLARFSDRSNGGIVQPVRSTIPVDATGGVFLLMPAYSVHDKYMSAKLLTYFPENEAKYKLPSIQAIITMFDAETGTPRAVLEGSTITALRTAAATAVAIRHLSQDADNVLAVIGTGLQARSHLTVLNRVRNFKEIRIYGRSEEKAQKLASEFQGTAYKTVEEAVTGADVIVTVTNSAEPVVFGRWVKTGALVNVVGANYPTTREVDDELILSCQVIADTRDGAAQEAGDIIQSKVSIDAELGDVVNGTKAVDWSRTRLFKSQGFAAEDLVAGKLVVESYFGQA